MAKLDNYLRTYRKRAGLSQREVAFLLGCRSGKKASRYELQARRPNLETILAYELIFATPARELFAGIYQKVKTSTLARVQVLAQKLATGSSDRMTNRKLAVLQAMSPTPVPSQS